MKETNVYTKIITDENLMETIPHGSQDYPFRYYYEHLAQFDFNCIDWHWHTELEFVYIQSGTVTAWIGEKQLELPADSGIFINSKFLHRFSSPVDAVIPNFLCMPSFLAATDSYIYQNYVKEFGVNKNAAVCWQLQLLFPNPGSYGFGLNIYKFQLRMPVPVYTVKIKLG